MFNSQMEEFYNLTGYDYLKKFNIAEKVMYRVVKNIEILEGHTLSQREKDFVKNCFEFVKNEEF